MPAARAAREDDPSGVLVDLVKPKPVTTPLTFARLDAEHALEKFTRLLVADGQTSAACNTSLGTWVFVPQPPKQTIPA